MMIKIKSIVRSCPDIYYNSQTLVSVKMQNDALLLEREDGKMHIFSGKQYDIEGAYADLVVPQ